MSQNRKGSPTFDALEGKLLLSTLSTTVAARKAAIAEVQAASATAAASKAFSLEGTLRMPVNTLATFQLSGQNYGTFKLQGKLASVGQVKGQLVAALDANYQTMSTGAVTLSNGRGSVTLGLTPDPVDITSYAYKVTAGTGAFANATGSGKLSTAGLTPNASTMFFKVTTLA